MEFASIAVVAVFDRNDGLAEVGQRLKQLALDGGEIAAGDLVALGTRVPAVGEQFVPLAEVLGQELVHKADVVVDAPHLENLLPAQPQLQVPRRLACAVVALVVLAAKAALVPAFLNVSQQLQPQLVGIKLAGVHGDGAGVVVGVVNDLGVRQDATGHDGAVPVASPAFVHDLSLALRREVVRLLAQHVQDIRLPCFERSMIDQEEHDITLRGHWEAPRLLCLIL